MMFKNDLTTRQWELYKFLKEQDDYINIKDIVASTNLYTNPRNPDRSVRKDLRALRASSVIQYTILSGTKGIKIATKGEYKNYSKRRWKALTRAIQLQKLQDKKAGLDNQIRFVFNQEKEVIEAFREASL